MPGTPVAPDRRVSYDRFIVVDFCPFVGREEQLSAVRRAATCGSSPFYGDRSSYLVVMGKIAVLAPLVIAAVVLASGGSGSDAWAAALVAAVVVSMPLAIISAWSHYPD